MVTRVDLPQLRQLLATGAQRIEVLPAGEYAEPHAGSKDSVSPTSTGYVSGKVNWLGPGRSCPDTPSHSLSRPTARSSAGCSASPSTVTPPAPEQAMENGPSTVRPHTPPRPDQDPAA